MLGGLKKYSAKVLRTSSESVLFMPWSPLTVGSWKEICPDHEFALPESLEKVCFPSPSCKIGQDPCIMYTPWPSNHYISESIITINDCLHYDAMVSLSVNVVSVTFFRCKNRNMCAVNGCSTHWYFPFFFIIDHNFY